MRWNLHLEKRTKHKSLSAVNSLLWIKPAVFSLISYVLSRDDKNNFRMIIRQSNYCRYMQKIVQGGKPFHLLPTPFTFSFSHFSLLSHFFSADDVRPSLPIHAPRNLITKWTWLCIDNELMSLLYSILQTRLIIFHRISQFHFILYIELYLSDGQRRDYRLI